MDEDNFEKSYEGCLPSLGCTIYADDAVLFFKPIIQDLEGNCSGAPSVCRDHRPSHKSANELNYLHSLRRGHNSRGGGALPLYAEGFPNYLSRPSTFHRLAAPCRYLATY
jgi:hypothetical protein